MMEVTQNTERELKRIRLYYACYDSKEIVLKTSVIKWKSPSARLNESKITNNYCATSNKRRIQSEKWSEWFGTTQEFTPFRDLRFYRTKIRETFERFVFLQMIHYNYCQWFNKYDLKINASIRIS